jgi:PAS domain S-box-containing protein
VKAADGTIREWLGTCDDHHQHRMQEEQNQFLVQLDDLIRPLIDPQEITQLAARMLALQLGANRCAYADVEGDENTINLTGDYNDGVSSIVGRYRLDSFGPNILQAFRSGQTFVSHNTQTDERTIAQHENFQQIETAAVIAVPLLKAGRLVAALSVQQSTPRTWRAHEIELVQKVAARCWESIERARITRELRQNEYRLRLAQHAGRIGSFEWLIPENCVIWSDELYTLYGITPGEFSGTFEDWEAHCVPEDAVRVREQIDEYLRAQEGEITYEFRSVHPDGTQRWLRGQAIFLYDSNGTPRKMIGVNIDVDELKRAVEALRTADLRKDEFLATLAHELRNPLAPIRNAIEILQLGNNDAESTQEIQNALERQVRQMTRLVDDLMDVSRITRGKLELIRDRTDLIAVLHSAIETSQPIISGSGQQLTLELASGPVTVDGDFTRLSQVFSNLLNNAAKYSEKGGVIHVRLTVTPTEAIVEIQDQGIGIPEEMLNEVFEPFTQVDRSIRRSQGGLGIGLTLVKRLVELHHGHVSARCNANGAGTVFTITLPRCRTSPPAAASPRRAAPGKESLPSHRVLVVDDTPAALFMVSKLLEKLGQTVFTASSAEEGIQLATELRPEIVISDIGMPCMDGYQLAETLRSLPWTSEMWIVALTGYGQESDRMKATAAGFNRHLVKPISLDALTALLREYPQAESNSGDTVRIR